MMGILSNRTSRVEIGKRVHGVSNFRGLSFVVPIASQSNALTDLNGATLNYYIVGYREEKNTAIMELMKSGRIGSY